MKKTLFLTVLLFSFVFSFAQELEVKIANKAGGDITVSDIVNSNRITVEDSLAKVVMFKVTIIDGELFTDYSNQGESFTEEQINIITNLQPKSIIYIKDSRIRGVDNAIHKGIETRFVIVSHYEQE